MERDRGLAYAIICRLKVNLKVFYFLLNLLIAVLEEHVGINETGFASTLLYNVQANERICSFSPSLRAHVVSYLGSPCAPHVHSLTRRW